MRVRVKICGVRDECAIDAAVDAGADAVGFVFADSPRRIEPRLARELCRRLPAYVTRVAVMRLPTAREIAAVARDFRPDALQLEAECRGLVPEALCSRVLPVLHDAPDLVDEVEDYRETYGGERAVVHLEGPGRGGRGIGVDRERAAQAARRCRLILAGGLTPDNVGEAIVHVRPFAVDVSSGVESSPGIKDPSLIEEFVAAVRAAERELQETP